MARLARAPTTWSDDDDEFPDIDALVATKKLHTTKKAGSTTQQKPKVPTTTQAQEAEKPTPAVRRRKLGPLTDNLLLRAWTPDNAEEGREERHSFKEEAKPRRTRVELRTRNITPAVVVPSSPADQDEEYVSAKEEVTIIEEVSMFGDSFHSCDSDGSEFSGSDEEEDDDDDVFGVDTPPSRPPAKPRFQTKDRKVPGRTGGGVAGSRKLEVDEDKEDKPRRVSAREAPKNDDSSSEPARKRGEGKVKGLADTLSKLRL
jgi:hypothetical protein